jgi:5'-3' exonuclease
MRILIDGDIVKYRVGFASQHTYYDVYSKLDIALDSEGEWLVEGAHPTQSFDDAKSANAWLKEQDDPDDFVRIARIEADPLDHCLHTCKVVMQRIQDRYPHGQMEVYFSCSTAMNWRTNLYPEYKANRATMRRPVYYEEIGEYMNAMYPTTYGADTEADDLIAMRADQLRGNSEFVVVTIDKDMDQIEGLHYNWVKEEEYVMDQQAARRSVALQAIAGDSTDNIKGIPKWGPAAALEWLQQCPLDNTDDIILAAYKEVYPEVEAVWRAALNTALVSLPVNNRQISDWSEDVNEAEEAYQQAQATADGCGAGVSEPGADS